jgi:hypothetical protein
LTGWQQQQQQAGRQAGMASQYETSDILEMLHQPALHMTG